MPPDAAGYSPFFEKAFALSLIAFSAAGKCRRVVDYHDIERIAVIGRSSRADRSDL
jgi:hypothetical protein